MTQLTIGARAQQERHRVVRAELLARLRPACNTMPGDIFLDMIESMAAIQVKYELRGVYDNR